MRWLDGIIDSRHELEQILGDSEGQGSLVWHAAILEVAELDMTE